MLRPLTPPLASIFAKGIFAAFPTPSGQHRLSRHHGAKPVLLCTERMFTLFSLTLSTPDLHPNMSCPHLLFSSHHSGAPFPQPCTAQGPTGALNFFPVRA